MFGRDVETDGLEMRLGGNSLKRVGMEGPEERLGREYLEENMGGNS